MQDERRIVEIFVSDAAFDFELAQMCLRGCGHTIWNIADGDVAWFCL
jgi:hypothetical protein